MPFFPGRAWSNALWQIVAIYAAAVALGLLIGRPWMVVAIVSIGVIAWHYWRLWRLLRRLTARQRLPPAQGGGVWDSLESLLHRRQTELRARKRRLVEMLRAYRRAAAALPDAAVILEGSEHRIVWLNLAATRLLGLSYPEDLGARFALAAHNPRVNEWLAGDPHEPLLDIPSPLDGTIRLNYRLIAYSETQWLLVVRDVSKLMHLEQVRRDFVANVSHELRTPLTVVHGYLDMLDPQDTPELAPMIEEMRRQSQRMTQLVEDLLTLSRLEAQEQLPEETVVSMAPLLRTLRREAEALSQGRHTITVEDQAGCDLRGSTKELHSAFSNLVSNAVRYTPAGGRIDVRFARDVPADGRSGGAVLSVQDSGYGIPSQHLSRITERFYRASTSRSRESGGTGLGLSIVKHVLSLHQARLEIESEVGRGSTFSCHFGAERVLPRATDAEAAA